MNSVSGLTNNQHTVTAHLTAAYRNSDDLTPWLDALTIAHTNPTNDGD